MNDRFEARSLGSLIDADIIETISGFPFGGHNDANIGVPHIRPFNIQPNGQISLEQIKCIPLGVAAGRPRLRQDDIVFNNTNTKELVGKCALWDRESEPAFSNHMTRIRVLDKSCHAAYLSLAILHHWMIGRSEMLARAHVAQASIMGERFREIEVPWRSQACQRAIARVIEGLRGACRLEAKQEEHAGELKLAALNELFTCGLRDERQKDSVLGPIPANWEVVPLGSLGRIGNGSTPKRTVPEYWNGGSYPWLTSAMVYDREIAQAQQFVTVRALDECHLPRVAPGAVLIAITGQGKTLGHCAVLRIEATVNQHIAYVTVDATRAVSSFVRGYLETKYQYLRQVAAGGGSTKGALTCAFLRDLPIPLPVPRDPRQSIIEQREIVAILDTLDRKIDVHRRKRATLEQLFKALLHKLMTGEIRVSDLNLSALSSTATPQASP